MLAAGSRFVIDAALPSALAVEQQVVIRHIDDDHIWLTVQAHDSIAQRLVSQEIYLHHDGTWRMLPDTKR